MTVQELATINAKYNALEASVRSYNLNADFDKMRRAFEYARDKHIHQRRKDGSPYITHPLAVAQMFVSITTRSSFATAGQNLFITLAPPPQLYSFIKSLL